MRNIENFEHFLNEGESPIKPFKVVEVGTNQGAIDKLKKEIKASVAGGHKVHMSLAKDQFHVFIEIPAGKVQYNLPVEKAAEVVDMNLSPNVTGKGTNKSVGYKPRPGV